MSEQGMRSQLIKALRPLDAVSVENSAYPGTPDINFVEGWMELKWLRCWPEREETPVLLPHFTQHQRVWLIRRARAGGNVWLMFKGQGEWLLFSGMKAAEVVGRVTRAELYHHATKIWREGLDEQELILLVSSPRKD